MFKDGVITIDRIQVFVFIRKGFLDTYNASTLTLTPDEAPAAGTAMLGSPSPSTPGRAAPTSGALTLAPWSDDSLKQIPRTSKMFGKPAGMYKLGLKLASGENVSADAVEDILLVCNYSVVMP